MRTPKDVQSQILVMDGNALVIINPEDEVTTGEDQPVEYPDGIMRILSGHSNWTWVDVWQDGTSNTGERTRLAKRLFAHRVSITRAWMYPPKEEMVQA